MTSRRALTLTAIIIWAAVAVTAAPKAFSHRHPLATLGAASSSAESCSAQQFHFDDHEAVVQTEEKSISKSEAPTLRVRGDANGGVYVEGWDKDNYSVTLCKAAESGPDADAILSQTHLVLNGGELRISTPSSNDRWGTHLLIRAPKAATLDVVIDNGPLILTHVDGNVKVHAQNGPVTVSGCSGELDLSAQNGPVTLEENSGKQTVHAQNGPLTLSLSGNSWSGSGLEARTTNGPVTLQIPSGYQSGVMLEAQGSSPFQCRAAVCSEGRKTWDDNDRRVEFGAGTPVVRISTENGPVSVR